MKQTLILSILAAVLGGCVAVPGDYGYRDNGYYGNRGYYGDRGYYRDRNYYGDRGYYRNDRDNWRRWDHDDNVR